MSDIFSDMELAAQRDSKDAKVERLERELAEARGLLADAYPVLLAYGVHNSAKPERVLMMDAIKLLLEFGTAREVPR